MVGKPEGRRPLGTPGHKQEVNIKMNLKENCSGDGGLVLAGSG